MIIDHKPSHNNVVTTWIKLLRSNNSTGSNSSKLRLFCFPHAGAGASVFYPWKKFLPGFFDCLPVQLPGREDRIIHPSYTQMRNLIPDLEHALLPYMDRPFAFFGHSLGAVISYELALSLRRNQGLQPIHIFVSGHLAPHIPNTQPPIYKLPQNEFVEKLKDFDGISDEVYTNEELMELLLPTIRADFTLSETYIYDSDEPLNCPITAFGGLQDSFVRREALQAWQEHTTAAFSVRMFSGNHFYLLEEEVLLVQTIASELQNYVQQF